MYCSKEHKKQTEQYNECDSGSVGRVRPCQGRGRGFEPRLSLLKETDTQVSVFLFARHGRALTGESPEHA